jgi:hypothetical protein
LIAAEAEQAAGGVGCRTWRLTGQAVLGLLAPARDAHQHDGRERHAQDQDSDDCRGYPDLIHLSSFCLDADLLAGRRIDTLPSCLVEKLYSPSLSV